MTHPANPATASEVDRLSAIIHTQQAIADHGHDEAAVMRLVVERSQALTGADGAVVELAEGDEMVYRYASGRAAASLGMRLKRAASLSGLAIATGSVLGCDDTETDERVDRAACRRVGCRSIVVVPLRHEQALVGVLKVMSAEPHAFGPEAVHTLQLLAGFIATAMRQAQATRLQQDLLDQLQRQQELMQRVFDHTPLAIAFVDRDLVYRWNNTAHCRIANLPADRIVGHSVFEWQPEFKQQLQEVYRRVLETGEPVVVRDRPLVLEVDGTPTLRRMDVSYVPAKDALGRVEGFVALGADVTERFEREQLQAERIAALQEADRLKDEFISIVSHELRTPLTSIRGSLGLLASGRMGTLPDKGQQMIQLAHNNCERLMRLVNDILDLAQIQAGKFRIEPVACDAADLAREALEAMQGMASRAQVTLRLEARPFALHADPGRIVQAIANLIGNAVKYSPPEGSVHVQVAPHASGVRFEVRDQGPGIPPDQQGRIFERFQQADSSDSRAQGGTGLGLSICRSIILAHGGQIGLASEPGSGSAFWVTLPAAGV